MEERGFAAHLPDGEPSPVRELAGIVEPTSANLAIRPANAIAANVETLSVNRPGNAIQPDRIAAKR